MKTEDIKRMALAYQAVTEKKMDPVGQADADIDNDGDVDKSDKYLHNRRKAIKKAMSKEAVSPGDKESVEIDEAIKYGSADHIKQPEHAKNFAGDEHYKHTDGEHSKKPANLSNKQAMDHHRASIEHEQAAEHHYYMADRATSANARYHHRHAAETHKQAAYSHDQAHYTDATHHDVHMAHHIGKIANEKSQRVQSRVIKKKRTDESVDVDAGNVDKALKHDCATHVTSEKYGHGTCISGMHTIEEQEDGTGIVTHYDVLFEHGIEEMVPVSELTVTKSESHMHAKKKMKEEVEEVQEGDRAAHYKGATPPEPMTKPEARSEKKMKDGHGEPEVNDTEEKGHIDAVEAGRVTKKAPARKGDNPASDKIEKPADTTKQGGFSEMVYSVAAAYRSMYEKKDEE